VLLQLREQTQAKGIRFELMNVSRPLNMILAMTHLDSVFEFTSRVEFFPAVVAQRQRSMAALKSCA
jgi:anti-anti-sigma regulatory factor